MPLTKSLYIALCVFAMCFVLSCSFGDDSIAVPPEKVDLNTLSVSKNQAFVQSYALGKEIEEVLRYTGIESIGINEIKLNTDNSHYFYFAAVVDFPVNSKGGYSSDNGTLSSIKRVNGCYIYELCKDSTNTEYAEEIVHSHLMFDKRISSVLNNDSLYAVSYTHLTLPTTPYV